MERLSSAFDGLPIRLRLAGVSPQMARVLRLTGLHRHLPVFGTVWAATGTPPSSEYGLWFTTPQSHLSLMWQGSSSKT